MGSQSEILRDLVIIITAAAAGGMLASLVRLPAILGYLLAGVVVAQALPSGEIDPAQVRGMAELGVALLLFTLGLQFSFSKFSGVRRAAIIGGIAQIALTIGLGVLLGSALGFGRTASLVLGSAMALSSTMVALTLMDARNELSTLHGRMTLGVLLVQDLAVVPLVILLPTLADESQGNLPLELGLAAVKAAVLLLAAYLLGSRGLPWLLPRVARRGSRELFLLTILTLALGLAAGSYALGLSIALGAFLAGLVVSESEFSYRTLAEVLPLRDVFATVFFVSMGMLADPGVLMDHPVQVVVVAAAIIAGKFFLSTGPLALLGLPLRTAIPAGLLLAQSGEFSFVLAQVGLSEGLISDDVSSVNLMASLASIVISPFLVQAGPGVTGALAVTPGLRRLFLEPDVIEARVDERSLQGHVVVCGYGRVGRELVTELERERIPSVVIELNPYLIDRLRESHVSYIYGDAANESVLDACRLKEARLLAITVPDPAAAAYIISFARPANPALDILVRGHAAEDLDALRAAGATEVVHPEFEASLEFIRHTLARYSRDPEELRGRRDAMRRDFYRRL